MRKLWFLETKLAFFNHGYMLVHNLKFFSVAFWLNVIK